MLHSSSSHHHHHRHTAVSGGEASGIGHVSGGYFKEHLQSASLPGDYAPYHPASWPLLTAGQEACGWPPQAGHCGKLLVVWQFFFSCFHLCFLFFLSLVSFYLCFFGAYSYFCSYCVFPFLRSSQFPLFPSIFECFYAYSYFCSSSSSLCSSVLSFLFLPIFFFSQFSSSFSAFSFLFLSFLSLLSLHTKPHTSISHPRIPATPYSTPQHHHSTSDTTRHYYRHHTNHLPHPYRRSASDSSSSPTSSKHRREDTLGGWMWKG